MNTRTLLDLAVLLALALSAACSDAGPPPSRLHP
jgi:hypothetical protein